MEKSMKIVREEEVREATVTEVARKMMTAARTAPKGKGTDNLVVALLDKEAIREVSDKLREMAKRDNLPEFFLRDAANILAADAMVVLGTKIKSMNLPLCGMCGFKNCAEKNEHPQHPCVFNSGDLGIALGCAVGVAADNRIDNRIMYTVGQALLEMGTLGEEVRIIYGIPLSVSAKNPFFDRNVGELLKK
jgi:uncharacterized ferredoxin-like protein